MALPEGEGPEQAEESLVQVLSGARAALDPLRVTLLVGHTTTAAGLLVGFSNERAGRGIVIGPGALAHARLPLLFDPQPSGGLVFGLPAERAALALERLHAAGDDAATIVGSVAPARADGSPIEVCAGAR